MAPEVNIRSGSLSLTPMSPAHREIVSWGSFSDEQHSTSGDPLAVVLTSLFERHVRDQAPAQTVRPTGHQEVAEPWRVHLWAPCRQGGLFPLATPRAWLGNPPCTVKSEDVHGLESIVGGDRGF